MGHGVEVRKGHTNDTTPTWCLFLFVLFHGTPVNWGVQYGGPTEVTVDSVG